MPKYLYWIPSIICMTGIYFFSSQPKFTATGEPGGDFIIFKALHMAAYGYLTLLNIYAVYKTFKQDSASVTGLAATLSFGYAITDEYHQTLVLSRSGTVRDIMFDGIGIWIIAIFCYKYWKSLKKYL